MRKHNFLKAVALTLCLALFASGTAFAATPGQALDAKEVNYGTLSRADQNILKGMFNAEEYAAMNEDVVKAVGKDANKLFAHFIKYGVFEGRGPSKSFNVSAYMSSYGDLQKAFGKDIMAYYRHYNNYGKKEKRELVTVEKAEAAGVVIKSVTGATKTVLPPSVQNPSSGSSESEVHAPIVTGIYYFDGSTIISKTQAEYDELVESAAAENPAVEMLSDTLFSMTVHYREDNATAWGTFKAEQQAINANINADIDAIDNHISVNVANGATASELLAEINSNMPGSLNYTWTAAEVVSGYTATTAGSQTVSVRFSAGAPANCSLPMDVTVVVAAASGGGGATAVAESDISTTNPQSLTLTEGYSDGNTVTLTSTAVENVAFTYAKTSGDAAFSISNAGVVTFATGQSAGTYSAVFTITATGSGTRTGTATKEITVNVTVNPAAPSYSLSTDTVTINLVDNTATADPTDDLIGTATVTVSGFDTGDVVSVEGDTATITTEVNNGTVTITATEATTTAVTLTIKITPSGESSAQTVGTVSVVANETTP